MPIRISLKTVAVLAGLGGAGLSGFAPGAISGGWLAPAAHAATTPTIDAAASAAVSQMAKTLLASQAFSFQVHTLRTYAGPDGQPLHIGHTAKITVRRPDRLLIAIDGDDGVVNLVYDGKTMAVSRVNAKEYSVIPVPGTIQGMMEMVMGRLKVDFPLADFLTDAPDKSFLFGVTEGKDVGTAMIDGAPCSHLFFKQPPDIELELWVEKEKPDQALPKRLFVTYRSLPDQPSFIAVFSDWNLNAQPTDAEFVFTPPEGAKKVEPKPAQ